MLSAFRRALIGNRKVSVVTGIAGYSKASYEKLGMLVLGAEEEGDSYGNVGEDAFFLKKTLGPVDNYGVADGVGGWRTKGVDPAIFSGTLMLVCKEESARVENQRELLAKAMDIMNAVHESGEKDLKGSSTAVLLSVNKEEDRVSLANLGDSGFVHIRAGEIESRSKDQTHYFNCPYQLSVKLEGSQSISDNPLDADEYELSVKPDDVLITATDGLLDNVPQEMICGIMDGATAENLGEKLEELCQVTLAISLDQNYMSPFALEARKQGYEREKGGKLDDLTIVANLFQA